MGCDKIANFFDKKQPNTTVKSEQNVKKPSEKIQKNDRDQIVSQLNNKLNDIKALRNNISLKQKEFSDKKINFQNKIGQLKNELINENDSERINNRIANIQEYDAYLQELDRRLKKLGPAPDKLLSLERSFEAKIEMVSLMTEDEINQIKEQINKTIKEYAPEAAELVIDSSKINLKSKEEILEEIKAEQEKESKKEEENRQRIIENQAKLNQEIWEEILGGVYDRIGLLTELSVSAAKKLGQSELETLNLSTLNVLSPEVAKQLSSWGGWELNLNGLKDISSKTAEQLSKWDTTDKMIKGEDCGNKSKWYGEFAFNTTLKLNGLTNLDYESAQFLSQWQGNCLELNGLRELLPETAKYLFKWTGNHKFSLHFNSGSKIGDGIYRECSEKKYLFDGDYDYCKCYNGKIILSINGVQNISRETAQFLYRWQGNAIFLLGVTDISSNAAVYLNRQNRSFRELTISDKIKQEYPEL